jgi:hypothetical protein
MLSAGLLGGPGLGYAKDRFSGEALKQADSAVFEEYKAEKPSKFLVFEEATGLDGAKFGAIGTKLAAARDKAGDAGGDVSKAVETLTPAERTVHDASITGDRKTLKYDSFIPATMAVIYLLLLLYFKTIGGYKPLHIEEQKA